MLASAAQDTLIRVWRIALETTDGHSDSINPALQSNRGNFSVFSPEELKFKCELETVLQGHENWVYGLHWQPPVLNSKPKSSRRSEIFTLISPLLIPQRWFSDESFTVTFLLDGQNYDDLGG